MKTEYIRKEAVVYTNALVREPSHQYHLLDRMLTEVARALLQRIDDGNEYIVRRNDREEYIDNNYAMRFTTKICVAELVRCKDCENWDTDWIPTRGNRGEHWCSMMETCTLPYDFCSKSERKEK